MKHLHIPLSYLLLAFVLNSCSNDSNRSISMQAISIDEWQEIVKNNNFDIMIVDIWASWCISCIERFPFMVEIERRFRGNKVRFVSINVDQTSDQKALRWANQFLQQQNAQFEHYHITNNMMETFDSLELIGIPAVIIYDANGNEIQRLTGDNPNQQFTDQDVENTISTLLNMGTTI